MAFFILEAVFGAGKASPNPDVLRNRKKESGAPLTAAGSTNGVLRFGSCFWRRQGVT